MKRCCILMFRPQEREIIRILSTTLSYLVEIFNMKKSSLELLFFSAKKPEEQEEWPLYYFIIFQCTDHDQRPVLPFILQMNRYFYNYTMYIFWGSLSVTHLSKIYRG